MVLVLFSVASHAADVSKQKVEEIIIEGLYRISSELVREYISIREGDILDKDAVRNDIKSLYNLGYFENIRVYTKPVTGGVVLIYRLKEKKYVRDVKFRGMKKVKKEDIEKDLQLKKGRFFDKSRLDKDVKTIRRAYEEKGYFLAEVNPVVKDSGKNAVEVIYDVKEGSPVRVKRIFISGNVQIPDEEIKRIMQTREWWPLSFLTRSGKYEVDKLSEDLDRIRFYYMDKGFLRVSVGQPVVEVSRDKKYIYISIPVEEGDKYYIGKIDVENNVIFSRSEIIKSLKTKEGEPFSRSKVGMDILTLTRKYEDIGYAYCNVEPIIRPDDVNKTVDITFRIETGELVYINRIDITGNTKTRDKVIRREIRLGEGDLYNASLLAFSRQRLMATGFFEEVKIKTRPQGERRMNLVVDVKEGRTGTLTAGVGFSSFESFIGTFQASFGNFMGYGQRVRMNFEISSRRKNAALSFLDNYFLDTDWSFGLDMYAQDQNYIDFTRRAYGGVIRVGRLITDFTRFYISYKLEKVGITDISGSGLSSLFEGGWTSSMSLELVRDTRDHPFDPKKGQYTIISTTLQEHTLAVILIL